MTHELRAYARTLDKDLQNLFSMNEILRDDLHILLDMFHDDRANQTLRRSLVRACWAYVEAVVFGIRTMTLRAIDLGEGEMTWTDRKFLTGISFFVSSAGEVRGKNEHPGALESIKRVFNAASKYFELPWKPSFSDGWLHVRGSIQLRDRLVHPKSNRQLWIADDEIARHNEAFEWFDTAFSGFFNSLLAIHAE